MSPGLAMMSELCFNKVFMSAWKSKLGYKSSTDLAPLLASAFKNASREIT